MWCAYSFLWAYIRTCLDGKNITIIESHSNKPWSNNNKFRVRYRDSDMHMKTGNEQIVYEYAYYTIAKMVRARPVMLPTKLVLLPSSEVAVLFPWQNAIAGGWAVSQQCHDYCNQRAFTIMVLDYLIGYVDRPANCHLNNNRLYAIDNDSGSATTEIVQTTQSYQYNILYKAMQTGDTRAFACYNASLIAHAIHTPRPPPCFSTSQATLWRHVFTAAAARLTRLQYYTKNHALSSLEDR